MTRTDFEWTTDCQIGDYHANQTTLHFDVEIEQIVEEPFSHGGSRGSYLEIRATFRVLMLDHLMVDRALLVQMIGAAEVAGLEERARAMFEKYGVAA